MRTIVIDLNKFALTNGDTITLQLVNSVGNLIVENGSYVCNETYTIENENILVELKENSLILGKSNYKLSVNNRNPIYFTINISTNQKKLDLFSLLFEGCKDLLIDDYFIYRFEMFLLGLDANFTDTEKQFVDLYIYFADNVHELAGVTNDLAEKFDIEIGSL